MSVSPIPTTRIHKDHPKATKSIWEVDSAVQTRRMHKQNEAGLIIFINKQRRTNHKDFQNCLFACFLSQMEPKKREREIHPLVNLPHGKKAIGTKWVFRNKKDQRGIVVRNKAKLVAQGHRQEKGIDYDEVFTLVARIEVIRLFLAYASFMDFNMYQMDVKSAFLYGTIEEEVYVSQPLGFVDPEFPNRISSIGELTFFLGLQVEQRKDGIFLSQDKYVCDILKKFGFSSVKSARTPMETRKTLSKDVNGTNVDVHLYRSMIGSLMYLTSSRPNIMFAVCACSRFQVQPKASHMHAVNKIIRYLKGQPTLGLWYPKDSPMDLIAYSDSDYAGASIDRKSTTGGCQFLGCRLISWQCKKQTIVANSTTKAEYIAASNCCGQILWLQNQLIMTKHIEIRHHFIRDSYEKKLIEMVKIHTDYNVADLLTKSFDVTRFQFLIASIGGMEMAATTASSFEVEQDSEKTITEPSKRHLKLEDNGSVTTLPNSEIFEQLALMGKVFSNMKRVTKGYSREDIPLFAFMITTSETSPSRITSSPSLSPQHTPFTALSTSQPSNIHHHLERSLIEELDLDADISLVPLHDAEIREKISNDTKVTTADTTLNIASVPISTASATPEVSIAATNLVYIRSEEKRKDKCKAIMTEDESIDEEERKRITRDTEIAKQLQEEYDKAGKKEAVAIVDIAHVIDWNDPSVIKYHALQHRPRSVAEFRKNMIITEEVSESVQEQTDQEPKTDKLSQEQLNQMVIIVPDEGINVEGLQTKYPIIGWDVYSEGTMQFWKIIRVENYTEVYQVFEDMLKDFDRDDLTKLWSLVQERYNSSGLNEDKEIELWVELKMLFEPNAEHLLEL
ncbi:putative reverse transcriptase, RNA-dependent DNA polymerase [Tanacetum coccineum]|uniref:Reverse transcriptase, RNA-dependent DNA polymerase n=1 Tax=Tanacetum coccineum TaxID=301880 RepID=A0ABQ5D458_9ASTR